MLEVLKVKSSAFKKGELIPRRYTARGEDVSPGFELFGVDSAAKSIAITMDDASHPIFPNFNHWVIWNIPVLNSIPEGIPKGEGKGELKGAMQGRAYGKNKYKGPKPPGNKVHDYVFTVYVLDDIINLSQNSKKKDFLVKIEGHILQKAELMGKFKSL